ncbi:hypothetical protein CXB49_02480 [Chromobacterium sp. ATCC 53434]|nr:hypothetical protein CXB49_02480 [Chromobacterium sp. ATCC 53434]
MWGLYWCTWQIASIIYWIFIVAMDLITEILARLKVTPSLRMQNGWMKLDSFMKICRYFSRQSILMTLLKSLWMSLP